jgi:hypothetical protein
MNPDYFNRLSDHEQDRLFATHLPLGENPNTGDAFWVPDEDRYAGTHVIGVQGGGKSSCLEGLIHHDIRQGNAVIVFDAHGDLADHCLAALPVEAMPRTSILDMEDEDFPFGANLFAQGSLTTDAAKGQAVERITHVFDVFWPEVMKQQYAPLYLEHGTRVLLENPGSTLLDLQRLLRHKAYRAQLLKRCQPAERDFWRREYDPLKPETQISRARPLLNRIQLLTSSPLLRNLICQARAIDFRAAIEHREVLFIKLPTTTLEKDASMVGMVLIGQINAAVFSTRNPVSLYVDEFQNFVTPDFEKFLSQGRKFRLRMVVSHQRRDQLSEKLQKATQSARTKVVFRVTAEDSRKLAQDFPVRASRPKPEDIHLYPCDYLLSHTHLMRDGGVLAFVESYLLPLQGAKSSRGQVVITEPEFRAEEFVKSVDGMITGALLLGHMLNGTPQKRSPVRVPDPTPTLDALLREVMATDNPRLPIPPVIVRGLANCGDFFSAVRNIAPEHPALQPGFTPPAHLIRVTNNGWQVLRAPESPSEWLAHCVFLLRHTMAYLAAHPLGNVKETSASEIAQLLTRLPKRHALIRSDDDFGPIKTFDAPEPAPGSEGGAAYIVQASRERYCRPREDVEAAFIGEDAAPDEPEEEESTSKEDVQVVDNSGLTVEPQPSAELPDEPAVSRWEL